MPDLIDDLSQRWKRNPDASATIALCEALRGGGRPTLVQQVGETAQQRHSSDVSVLLAVARMYLETDRLGDAQTVLVSAGKLAPRDGAIYRWLGEVLLRRGDAERSEKVLERAMQLGTNDPETRLWLDRARVFKPVQGKAGPQAVAAEIARAAPTPPPPRARMDSLDDSTTNVHVASDADDDADTKVHQSKEVPAPRRVLEAETVPFPTPSSEIRAALESSKNRPNAGSMAARPEPAPARTQGLPPPQNVAQRPAPAPAPPAPAARPWQPPPAIVVEDKVVGAPSTRDVLQALAGIFEPPGDAAAAMAKWDRPVVRERRTSAVLLGAAMLLFAGSGYGVFRFVKDKRMKEHLVAETALQTIENDIHASRASLLPGMEDAIGKTFELDSRSPRAALDWLRERALVGLLKGGADLAFEDAISRATEVHVPEEQIAFARLASFLFQGDTAGAAALMPRWDTPAASDAWYQLLAGATLERAGDPRATDRYAAAAKLDPDLMIAQMAVVRQTAIDGDAQKAADLAKQFRAKFPDRPEGAALVSLAWGRDPGRGEQPPADVAEMLAHAGDLPLPLKAIPHAVSAILAVDKHAFGDAKTQIEQGLQLVDSPGVASWLGSIAIDTGDEALARKAALSAVTFSAVYPPARVLAARVALLGDRLDEALKAADELEASLPDVAVVRAAVAYERVDLDGVERALEAVPAEARQVPSLSALSLAANVLLGTAPTPPQKILDMSGDEAPWSGLVAMDLALDLGQLDVAEKIGTSWNGSEANPLRALRLSRLARYQNKLDVADTLSKTALESGTVTVRTLEERVFVLVARNHNAEVGPLLAKFPLLQANATWLRAYAQASGGKVDEARGKTASVDPPPALAALPSRVMAAVALAAMKDKKRGTDYIKALLASGIQDPDLVAAAASLGIKKVDRPTPRGH